MSASIFLLWLVSIPFSTLHALPAAPRGFHINCGASKETSEGSIKWLTDDGFIIVGNASAIKTPGLMPILSTVRYFPDEKARKYCYSIPVTKGGKYIVRTTYYYGGFDGGKEPPVFDQIIDGSKWSTVNTTENFSQGLTSYYEITVAAKGKTLSVCLARNEDTKSSPFLSALELEYLEDSMYNSTNFGKYGLSTVARNSFGYDGKTVSFPDDPFNRHWEPFIDNNPTVDAHSNISSSDFWNHPPAMVLSSAITTSRGKKIEIDWPAMPLPKTNYYIALYFQDNRTPSPYSWRVFDVSLNGKIFYKGLNVSTSGVTVYGKRWPLEGRTKITLTPTSDSPVGPVINAGEIFQLWPLGGRTVTRDVIAMEEVARSFNNPPADWSGDPCLPYKNSWTGVECSEGNLARVVSLNLTNFGLAGSLSPKLANLTALSHIWLGGNKLTGSIPNLSTLTGLDTLHLEDNQLSGKIPQSLGSLENLKEISLKNNKLEGDVPDSLKKRKGVKIEV